MLFYEAFDLQERWKKIPFVPGCVDRIRQGFAMVEGFEERIETLSGVSEWSSVMKNKRYHTST